MHIPSAGCDAAASSLLPTLSAAVIQRPLLASQMSTELLTSPPPAQRIGAHLQGLKPRLPPPNTRPPPTPTSHNLPISTKTQTKNHKPVKPPANMANPCLGSDVAASTLLATLSAAVIQRPLLASKMSTELLTTPPPAQRISAHLQRLNARLPPPNTRPPDSNITQSPNINNSKQKSQT